MSKRLSKAITSEFLKAVASELKAAVKAKEFNFEVADARENAAAKLRKVCFDLIDDLVNGNLNQ